MWVQAVGKRFDGIMGVSVEFGDVGEIKVQGDVSEGLCVRKRKIVLKVP